MRVISLVPSWTETLVEAGVEVVGRTRYCIHPLNQVQPIPVVGGTKSVNWEKIKSIPADLLLLDKEENPLKLAEESPLPWIATHVQSVRDMESELQKLAASLQAPKLATYAERWRAIAAAPLREPSLSDLPGVTWWRRPTGREENFLYLIWKDPWMTIAPETFIGSMLSRLGYGRFLSPFEKKYPEIQLTDFDPEKTVLLYSSEPFPFGKFKDELLQEKFPAGLIDGESYSWFGLRALRFLEEAYES